MPLTSSTITLNERLKFGDRRVHELHVDHLGREHRIEYTLPVGDDVNAVLAVHAANLLVALASQEVSEFRERVGKGEDVRTIPLEFNRLLDIQEAFTDFERAADAEEVESTRYAGVIRQAKTDIG